MIAIDAYLLRSHVSTFIASILSPARNEWVYAGKFLKLLTLYNLFESEKQQISLVLLLLGKNTSQTMQQVFLFNEKIDS